MQHLCYLAGLPGKTSGAGNRSVGGHLALGHAANGGFDAHPDLRFGGNKVYWRRFGGADLCAAFRRGLASLPAPSFFHSAIHPMRISQSDTTETSNHKIIPSSSGRCPTRLIVATEMPVPIKNKVAVNPIFASFTAKS